MKSGQLLEIVLDDGEPIENVPRSVILEGHNVLKQERNGEQLERYDREGLIYHLLIVYSSTRFLQ